MSGLPSGGIATGSTKATHVNDVSPSLDHAASSCRLAAQPCQALEPDRAAPELRSFRRLLGRSWKESAGACLIVPIPAAAGSQHLDLEWGYSGDVHEYPVHDRRRDQARPAPCVACRQRDRRVGEPPEPFEEIVRMTRPAPKPDITDQARICLVPLEASQLLVGDRLACNGRKHDGRADIVLNALGGPWSVRSQEDREWQRHRCEGLRLQEREHAKRRL